MGVDLSAYLETRAIAVVNFLFKILVIGLTRAYLTASVPPSRSGFSSKTSSAFVPQAYAGETIVRAGGAIPFSIAC